MICVFERLRYRPSSRTVPSEQIKERRGAKNNGAKPRFLLAMLLSPFLSCSF